MEQTETAQTAQTAPQETAIATLSPVELAIGHTSKIIRLTDTGLEIPEDLAFEEWYDLLRSVKWFNQKLTIGFADLIEYGNKNFGMERVNNSLEQLEFELPLVKQAISVNSIPTELRHAELTAEHYVELAKADLSKKDKIKWAELAARLRLTATQLRISMAAGEVVDTAAARALSTGVITIPGIRQEFDVWLHRVGGFEGVQKMEVEVREEILEELEPIAEFFLKLEEALSESPPAA